MSDLNIETRPCTKGSMIYPQPLYRRVGLARSMNSPGRITRWQEAYYLDGERHEFQMNYWLCFRRYLTSVYETNGSIGGVRKPRIRYRVGRFDVSFVFHVVLLIQSLVHLTFSGWLLKRTGFEIDRYGSFLFPRNMALGLGQSQVQCWLVISKEINRLEFIHDVFFFFPSWLISSLGESSKTVELPHTITTWVGRALCVSESHGFGMSSIADIEAFQPFFLEMHLPYSVKRSEKLELKISVFNYASHSLPIRLTLAYSEQFELLSDSDSILLCVPAKDSLVHHYVIHAIDIGTHNVSASATIDDHYPGECGPEVLPSVR